MTVDGKAADGKTDDDNTILVLAASEPKLLGGEKLWKKIDLDTLRDNLNSLMAKVQGSLPEEDPKNSSFRLTQIAVAVTIGAKGEVGLLGTGAEASGSASLTLTLTRPQ
jgi:hypothetical protein